MTNRDWYNAHTDYFSFLFSINECAFDRLFGLSRTSILSILTFPDILLMHSIIIFLATSACYSLSAIPGIMAFAHWLVAGIATLFFCQKLCLSFNIFFMKFSHVSKIWIFPYAIHDISTFCKPLISSFFELVTEVLILFLEFSFLLDLFSLHCSMASFENKGSFTSEKEHLRKAANIYEGVL